MPDSKVADDANYIPEKRGNGILRREIWVNEQGQVTRYNLAYINHAVYQADNGRVLGFDNAHGYHHRHYMGEVEAVDFVSYEATLDRFQQEWLEISGRTMEKKS